MRRRAVVVGTRGSALALTQTGIVVNALQARHPDLAVEIRTIATKGDILQDVPLRGAGMRSAFVDAIEEALLAGEIDLAVHSAKDMPSTLGSGLAVGAFLERLDPRDVLVSPFGKLERLPVGTRVGTSSRRRVCALHAARWDLEIVEIRGNVDTRLRKLDAGQLEAIVLAGAGLMRLGLTSRITHWLPTSLVLPSPGQGALAIEVRADDDEMRSLVARLDHHATTIALTAERAFLARLGAGCAAAVGALALLDASVLTLEGSIGAVDGRSIRASDSDSPEQAAALGARLADAMLAAGGRELLEEAATRPA